MQVVFILVSALEVALDPKSTDDEHALVQRAQRLEEEAWQTIYDRYYNALYGYLYYRVGNPDQAEDLTAQVFERAVKNIGRYRYRGSSLGAWLNRIAQNLATDLARRQKVRPPEPLQLQEEWISTGRDPARHVVARESSQLLAQAMAQLTPDQREVILLRFVARMTSPQIGDRLGKSTGAIKALQHRALEALRRELEALNYHYGIH